MKKIVEYTMLGFLSISVIIINIIGVIFVYETIMQVLTVGVTVIIGEVLVTIFCSLLVLCLDSIVWYAFLNK